MRIRRRFIFGSSLALVTAGIALAACVGDDPSTVPGSDDASTSSDTSIGADTAVADTGPPPAPDASDAAVETFDGSNPTCNGLFPQDAPMPATIECDGGAILSPSGGTISPGRYYLVDQKYPSGTCPPGVYSDVIDISATSDGGLTVNAALNGAFDTRLTLAWAVSTGLFDQYDICPSNGKHVTGVGYNASSTTLTYFLPGLGNLTYQKILTASAPDDQAR